MFIYQILNCIRNIDCIMIHTRTGYTKSMEINEIDIIDSMLEFEWFEVTTFQGKRCLEFTIA